MSTTSNGSRPNFQVDGESVYDRLRQPKFHLLAFTDEASPVHASALEAESQYAELVDFQSVPLSPQAAEAFGTDKSFNVLLRPDNYIGYISAESSSSELRAYLKDFIGHSL